MNTATVAANAQTRVAHSVAGSPERKAKRQRKPTLRQQIGEDARRRREALQAIKDGRPSGLVPVRCEKCQRPIATTKVDQAKGEPPILLEFPENATGWTCTRCVA